MVQHHEPEFHAEEKLLLLLLSSRSRSQWGLIWSKYDSFYCYLLNCWFFGYQTWSDDTSSQARVSFEKKLIAGHSEVLCKKNLGGVWYLLNYWPLLLPNFDWEHSMISQSVLWKTGITAFKIKVTAKVQNVSECLSGLYFLNHKTFCYQIWYGDAASWASVLQNLNFFCCLQGQGHSEGSYD